MTQDNENHLPVNVNIVTKWLASRTDDDDADEPDKLLMTTRLILSCIITELINVISLKRWRSYARIIQL